jgi:hypothetical protein
MRLAARIVLVLTALVTAATGSGAAELTDTFTAEELLAKLRNKLAGDEILGIWIDEKHVCGLAAISTHNTKLHHTLICSDGSSSDSVDELAPMKAPRGAKRAWKTPGLTRRPLEVAGSSTFEYVDTNGEREDLYIYVEKKDGQLYGYQDGVGLEGTKDVPWMVGRPIE